MVNRGYTKKYYSVKIFIFLSRPVLDQVRPVLDQLCQKVGDTSGGGISLGFTGNLGGLNHGTQRSNRDPSPELEDLQAQIDALR